jgi:hypothetical protein
VVNLRVVHTCAHVSQYALEEPVCKDLCLLAKGPLSYRAILDPREILVVLLWPVKLLTKGRYFLKNARYEGNNGRSGGTKQLISC